MKKTEGLDNYSIYQNYLKQKFVKTLEVELSLIWINKNKHLEAILDL